jgi:hypothetical protein
MNKMAKGIALIVGVVIPLVALAANYKKDYCAGSEYLGNAGGKYPHLHCGKDFLTFSTGPSKHSNLNEGQGKSGAGCKRAAAILADPPYTSVNTSSPQAITDAINRFVQAECQ